MLNEHFADAGKLARYRAFTEEMVSLILDHRGSLKAEHGTGRIMAPYVRRQFGDELYEVMRQVKELVDPGAMLNPGVIINDDPEVYLKDLKVLATVEEEVDRCVECGYCEPVCPSKDLTTTPRQRIVIRREMQAARERGDEQLLAQLEAGWKLAARGWGVANTAAGLALSTAKALPWPVPRTVTTAARTLLGDEAVPQYTPELPAGGRRRASRHDDEADFVFFPTCVNAMFGGVDGDGEGTEANATAALMQVAYRAGLRWATPEGIGAMCCGTPWKSKGASSGYQVMSDRVVEALREVTRGGELPVVADASSCTEGLQVMLSQLPDDAGIRAVDAVEFAVTVVLPRLAISRRLPSLVLHPTCNLTHLGLLEELETLGRAVAEDLVVPLSWGCCGYAGDRGMLHPELTASATRAEAAEVAEVAAHPAAAYATSNRTCEQGMTEATGRTYQNILQLLEWASR